MSIPSIVKAYFGVGIFILVMWFILNFAIPGNAVNIEIGILTGVVSGMIVLLTQKGILDKNTKRVEPMNTEEKKNARLKVIAILWYLGYSVLVLGFIIAAAIGLTEIGLAAVAIGLGVVALSYTLKTDELVNSIADLNFYEKIAAIAGYVIPLLNTDDPSESINLLCILRYDLKSITSLHGRISPEQKIEFNDIILQTIVPIIQIKERQATNTTIEGQRNVMLEHIHEIKKLVVQIYGKDVWKN